MATRSMNALKNIDAFKPTVYTFFGVTNDALNITYTFQDSDGNAVDLSANTYEFLSKQQVTDTSYLIQVANGGTGENLASGIVSFDITLNNADLLTLVSDTRPYDLVCMVVGSDDAVLANDVITVTKTVEN